MYIPLVMRCGIMEITPKTLKMIKVYNLKLIALNMVR